MITFKNFLNEKLQNKALNFLASNLDDIEKMEKDGPDDELLGKTFDFIFSDSIVKISIKENQEHFILTGIKVIDPENRKETKLGTGKGTKVLNLFKDYSDKTNKEFIIIDPTGDAKSFWNKFSWLKFGTVQTKIDNEIMSIEAFVYNYDFSNNKIF